MIVFKVFKAVLIAVALSVVVMVFVATAWSQEIGEQARSFEFSPEWCKVNLSESGYFKNTGSLYGLNAAYLSGGNESDFKFRLEGRVDWGNLNSASDIYGDFDKVKSWITEVRALGVKENSISADLSGSFKSGLGYKFVSDDSSGQAADNGSPGMLLDMNYIYLPIGGELVFNFGEKLSLTASAEYDQLLYGWMNRHFSQADPGLADVNYVLRIGHGIRGSIKLTKKTDTLDFIVEPFVNYWSNNATRNKELIYYDQAIGSINEPRNALCEYGVKAGVSF